LLIKVITFLLAIVVASVVQAGSVVYMNGALGATQNAAVPTAISASGEKVILIDPKVHAWGAYNAKGKLVRWGIASAGASWCADIQKSCRTRVGDFRVYSAGNKHCSSSKYPIAQGGAPMPFCMYFSGGQAIHGANQVEMTNKSHGCVRLYRDDAKWLRYHFVDTPSKKNNFKGTKVIVRSY